MAVFTLITAGLGAAGFGGAITIFGLSPGLSAALLNIGKAVLWQEAQKALQPKAPRQEVQANIAQAAGARVRGYGTFLLGGTRALFEAQNGTLYQINVLHHGAVDAITGWLIDGEEVTLDGSGNVTSGAAAGYMKISSILSGDGGNYAAARAAFPTIWTTDHRLAGLATAYVEMTAPSLSRLQKVFPRQSNTLVQAICRQSLVRDPRTGLVGYSDLTGPAAMDYLTHPDGYRIPLSAINEASFAAFTDLCDQDVPIVGGGTEKRYGIGGYYTLEDAPKDVLNRILATADAQIYMDADGRAAIMGGQWVGPDVTIDAADILEIVIGDGFDEFTDFNILKGTLIDPTQRWQEAEVDPLIDTVSLLTQPERTETLDIGMCPSWRQLRRLMKAHRAGAVREIKATLRTNLVGLKARFPRGVGKHVIRVTDAEDGMDMVFEVLAHSYSVAERTCSIEIASIENPYGWTPEADEGNPPPALDDLEKPTEVNTAPAGMVVLQEVVALASDQNAVRIVVTVSDPGNAALELLAEYRKTGDTLWQRMLATPGARRAVSDVLTDGQQYQVRASWVSREVYTATETITVVSNPTAPGAATGLSRSYAAPNVTLAWTNGTGGYYRTRIYRGTTTTFASATLIATVAGVAGAAQTFVNAPGTGTWHYWAVTINASLIEATPTGPVSQTI